MPFLSDMGGKLELGMGVGEKNRCGVARRELGGEANFIYLLAS
jgi:hypothetical protein